VRTRALAVAATGTAIALGACLDFSPLPYSPDAGGADASVTDAVVDVGNIDALKAACATCIAGTCTDGQTACNANPKCAIFSACLTAAYCWQSTLTNLADLPPCVTMCALTAGVTSQNDPGAALLAPIYTCSHDPARCGPECAPGAASVEQ
jgi:hypothetical protein